MLYINLGGLEQCHHDSALHALQINTPTTGLIHGHNADLRSLDYH
ncbi:hypothetical protein [Acidithiobacillus ferrivorans]|nr:hypothetical protein [Acidithiobacillus ferrivorans]